MKAGTTSLAEMLEQHPQIYLCPIKEPHHFIQEIPTSVISPTNFNVKKYLNQNTLNKEHLQVISNKENYEQLFREAPQSCKYLAEASTGYLHAKESADLIYNYNSEAKIIILVRDGLKRAYSHYKMNSVLGRTANSFEHEMINELKVRNRWGYISMSEYYDDSLRYLSLFKNNVLIITLKDVLSDSSIINHFLNIEEFDYALPHSNVSKEIKHKWLIKTIKDAGIIKLLRFFIPTKVRHSILKVFQKESNGIPLSDETKNKVEFIFNNDKSKLKKHLK